MAKPQLGLLQMPVLAKSLSVALLSTKVDVENPPFVVCRPFSWVNHEFPHLIMLVYHRVAAVTSLVP